MVEVNRRASSQWLEGAKSAVPIMLGYIPIAITYGVLGKQGGMGTLELIFMSLWVYSGAGQFVVVSMVSAGVNNLEIILATTMLTLRHIVLELYYNTRYSKLKLPWKITLPLGITDETFAMLSMEENKSEEFMAGLMAASYLSWVFGTLIGCIFVAIIPMWLSKSMEIGLYALFITLLVGSLQRNISYISVTVISMVCNWILSMYINKGWAIVISIVIGALFGMKFIGGKEE